MAQSAIASQPTNGTTMNLTEEQRKELREYEKIIHFRDVVYSGTHPRIKLPSHMAVKPLPTTSIPTAPQPSSTAPAVATSITAEKRNERQERTQGAKPSPGAVKADTTGERRPLLGTANNTGINPIFLEKSDTLRRAEIQIRRKDIERVLREQIAKQQTAAKVAQVTGVVEQLPDFDVHEVLSKALAIARTQPVDARHALEGGGLSPAASDSFDDNTFYSSVVESPELSTSSRERLETGEVTSRPPVPLSSAFDGKPASDSTNDFQNRGQNDLSSSRNAIPGLQATQRKQTPPSQHGLQGREQLLPLRPSPPNRSQQSQQGYRSQEGTSANSQSTASRGLAANGRQGADRSNATSSTGSVITRLEGTGPLPMDVDSAVISKETVAQVRQVLDVIPQQSRPLSTDEPGDVRNFNLSPVAPQPVRVSPLATAKDPLFTQQTLAMDDVGGNDGAATERSTAASSQDGKRKGKRKHSNGRSGAPTSPTPPYIKTEPRSPSPFIPAQLPRPNKRPRQTVQQSGGLDYDEPSHVEPRSQAKQPQQQPSQRNARNARRQPPTHQQDDAQDLMEIDEPRYRRALQDEPQQRRIVSHEVSHFPPSRTQALPYSPYQQRLVRPANQLVIDPYEQSARYIQTPVSASVRPGFSRGGSVDLEDRPRRSRSPVIMAPPPRMSSRLVVDEYGNQYYASIPVVPRQSMLPQSRVVEQEYIFDRPAPRRVARPLQHFYEEDGVMYQREPTYAPQQRVIYVPDHLPPMTPVSRQRAASMRPPPPAQPPAEEVSELESAEVRHREHSRMPTARGAQDGYVRVNDDNFVRLQNGPRGRQATHFEQPQIMRVASVRPEQNIRYEAPPVEYYGRQHSQVPIIQARRERGMSIRGEDGFVDTTSPIYRTVSTRPGEGMGPPRREYVQPVERYQSVRPPASSGMDDEVEYVSQQPVRQVTRRVEGHIEYAPRRDPQLGSDSQPQYLPRRQAQQIYEDGDHQQAVYR